MREAAVFSGSSRCETVLGIMSDDTLKTLYVGNLDHAVSEDLLYALFSHIGSVRSCKIIRETCCNNNEHFLFILAQLILTHQCYTVDDYGYLHDMLSRSGSGPRQASFSLMICELHP